MASWLKAAEDLFEVVDRRAKLVVNELADEQSDFQTPASNGQGSQAKKIKSRIKAQRRHSADESLKINDTAREQANTQASPVDVTPNKDTATLAVEKETITTGKTQKNGEQQQTNERDAPSIPLTEQSKDMSKHDADQVEIPETFTDLDTATPNGEILNENDSDVHLNHPPSPLPPKEMGIVNEDRIDDAGQITKSADADAPLKIDSKIQAVDPPVNSESSLKDADVKVETLSNKRKQQALKADDPPTKEQDQLDEAQGLLKTTISTGQSKEARLARVCAGLSSRLQEYKSENAQLEELLVAERELSRSYEARIKQLEQELSVYKSEVTKVESNLAEALAAKNSEIETLVSSIDALKKQAALSEGNLASLQMNMESIMRNRELTETRMIQALREELASVERRAEEERAAHNATKMAAMEREVELEHRAAEASMALARIQRIADERTAKAGELEQKVAMLEVECATLQQELQDMEARLKRGQKKSPEEANQAIQMQAWQDEVERARQGQRDAENKLSSLEAEVQKMRVEMAAMKRDAEHYSREEHMELEKRYRELTDLLYYKQTQLETMASEKAAAEFQLEKEMNRLQEVQSEAERSRVSRRSWSSWEEDAEMKSLEPLPLHHRHIAGASVQLQKAAKLLDSGAVRATRFLWRYPIARIILLFYLVFVHLFLMYLLHRLQEQADNFAAREVAESMGLTTSNLP
ncbi:golgin candidate 1 [Citrus sinensis]|uniref:golgin candidate 1 isoform X3 n=1 Tax=Citrus sinensis TaxID=2711 RepID=UPI0003D70E34|nr:golgin candidate 1 isoform X3 [Citrus sinensis]KAH9762529.1 golgin candidate 1 [Citrus sinensis]